MISETLGMITGGITWFMLVVRRFDQTGRRMMTTLQFTTVVAESWISGVQISRWASGVKLVLMGGEMVSEEIW